MRFASWGGKSVVTRRCRRIWLSWFRVVCFSAFVIGSGGMILSYKMDTETTVLTSQNYKGKTCLKLILISQHLFIQDFSLSRQRRKINKLTRIHVGKRGYDPVVRTSMAKGMAKLGKRACTRASLASNASLSAVSTKRMVCWSRKLEIICDHGRDKGVSWFSVLIDTRIFEAYYENQSIQG